MKLESDILQYVISVINTAMMAKIEAVIIEPDRVRAVDDGRSVVMLHQSDIPSLPFPAIALTRLSTFVSRFDLAKLSGDVKATITMDTTHPYVRSINLSSKGFSVDYRCSNPETIRVPKKLNDIARYQFNLSADIISLITKASSAMSNDDVVLKSTNGQLFVEMNDTATNDKLTYDTGSYVEVIDNSVNTDFSYTYSAKLITSLLKHDPNQSLYITASTGLLKVNVNNFDMYMTQIQRI